MKLNSVRDKDKVQLQILEQVGLITDDLVCTLPEELQRRLHDLRSKWREEDLEL